MRSPHRQHVRPVSPAVLFVVAAICAGVCFITSCQSPHTAGQGADGELIPVLRRSMWWSFYERGLAYSRARRWQEAIADLETAAGIREGAVFAAPDDRRRAKTYGVRFIDDYFPHRELGVAHFYLGDFAKAEKELQNSLQVTPSSRAKHYLNRVQEEALREKTTQGQLPPAEIQMTVETTPGGDRLNSRRVACRGRLTGKYPIGYVAINGRRLFVELATSEYVLDHTVDLEPGPGEIVIEARDLAGNVGTWRRSLLVDTDGPCVSGAVRRAATGGDVLDIVVTDNDRLAAVEIDGQASQLEADARVFRTTVPIAPGRTLSVSATDATGNTTSWAPSSDELAAITVGRIVWPPVPVEMLMQSVQDPQVCPCVADDGPCGALAALPAGHARTAAPQIGLYPAVGEDVQVTAKSYVLDCVFSDPHGLRSFVVKVNGKSSKHEIPGGNTALYRWNRVLDLQPGDNDIEVSVRDSAGNESVRKLTIERLVGCMWREDLRMGACLLPPDRYSVPALRHLDLYGMLLGSLLERPRRLRIVERDVKVLERIVIEHEINSTNLSQSGRSLKRRGIVPSEWMVYGYCSVWAGENNWDLVVNVVDTATGRILFTTDMHFASHGKDYVASQVEGLAVKMKQRLPAASAPVELAEGHKLTVPIGGKLQVVPGMRFVFIGRSSDRDWRFADPARWHDEWLQAEVTEVEPERCTVEFRHRDARSLVRPSDLAVLR